MLGPSLDTPTIIPSLGPGPSPEPTYIPIPIPKQIVPNIR